MEEAPLIIRRPNGLDKCGSCNHLLSKDNYNDINQNYENTKYTKINTISSIKNPCSPDFIFDNKFQLKNIQDTSNKLGFGSYSRLISNLPQSDIIDDVKFGRKQIITSNNNNNLLNLPDILSRESSVNLFVSSSNNTNTINYTNNNNSNTQIKLLSTLSPITNTNQSTEFSNDKQQKKNLNFLDNINYKSSVKPRDILKVIDKYHSEMVLTQSTEILNTCPGLK